MPNIGNEKWHSPWFLTNVTVGWAPSTNELTLDIPTIQIITVSTRQPNYKNATDRYKTHVRSSLDILRNLWRLNSQVIQLNKLRLLALIFLCILAPFASGDRPTDIPDLYLYILQGLSTICHFSAYFEINITYLHIHCFIPLSDYFVTEFKKIKDCLKCGSLKYFYELALIHVSSLHL